jgi:hypothetical protein
MSQPGFHHESSVLRGFENELSGINPSGVASAIVLLTPHLAENDTALIRKIAYAFHQQGSSVIWRIRADAGAEKRTMYVPPSGDCSANGKLINRNRYFGRTHAVGEFFRRLQGKLSKTLYMLKGQRLEESLTKILSKLKPGSSVLMAFPTIEDFHDIFLMVASLQLDRPMPCTLHVLSKDFFLPELSGSWRSVARRLQSGSPFETIMFHSDGRLPLSNEKENCTIDFPIHELTAAECESTTLVKRFGFVAPVERKAHHATIQAMKISKFGPIAIQVSALWGRVGSTAIFEAQARYLIERGFF